MKSLFSSSELRRLELIELLLERDGFVHMFEAASILNCSDRILASDVELITKMCQDINLKRIKKNLYMTFKEPASIIDVYRCFLSHNQNYQLLELIFFEDHLHTDDIQERFDISQATLYRQVNVINHSLKENFNLTLETNPFHLVGKESTIRNFYYLYFSEKYAVQNWPFPDTPYDSLDQILSIIESISGNHFYFGNIHEIKTYLAINTIRLCQGRSLEAYRSDLFLKSIIPSFVNTLASDNFRSSLPESVQAIETPRAHYELFYPFISDAYIFDYRAILQIIQQSPQLNLNLMKIHHLIYQLQSEFNLEINNLSEFIIEVNNTIQSVSPELKRGYILYNRSQPLFDYYQTEFPLFYQRLGELTDELLEGISQEGYFLYDSVMQAILTSWKDLPLQLQKDPAVKIILINAHSTSMMEFYRELLTFELPQPVQIKVWRDYPFSREKIMQTDCDIIVSNIQLPEMEGKEIIYAENITYPQTIDKLMEAINKVRHHRNITKEGAYHA